MHRFFSLFFKRHLRYDFSKCIETLSNTLRLPYQFFGVIALYAFKFSSINCNMHVIKLQLKSVIQNFIKQRCISHPVVQFSFLFSKCVCTFFADFCDCWKNTDTITVPCLPTTEKRICNVFAMKFPFKIFLNMYNYA